MGTYIVCLYIVRNWSYKYGEMESVRESGFSKQEWLSVESRFCEGTKIRWGLMGCNHKEELRAGR